MTTRWQKIREQLKPITDKDIIAPEDIKTLEKLKEKEFKCTRCEYLDKKNAKFLCDGSLNYCKRAYANYLNEEVGE